jgi:hypothetical protein
LIAKFLLLLLFGAVNAVACQDQMDLIDTVRQLEKDLVSESISARDEAEKKIIALGPGVLELLMPVDSSLSTDLQTRLRNIRKAFETEIAKAVSKSSTISLAGKHSLKKIMDALTEQTGNKVMLSEQAPAELLDTLIDCAWEQAEFWPAIYELTKKAGLTLERYEGNGRELVLTVAATTHPDTIDSAAERYAPVNTTAGVLAMEVSRVDTSINLNQPKVSYTNIEMVMRWEPRLKPVAINVPYSELTVTDDKGTVIVPPNESSASIMLQPQFASSDFSLQIPLIERAAKEISSLEGIIHLLVPGRMERFEFANIDAQSPGTWQEKASATVTFGGITKNEDLFALKMSLSFPNENNLLESHHSWALENPVYLLKESGERIDFIGLETFEQSENSVGVNYLFPEMPPGAKLVYETPSAIVKLSVPFSLKKIPLP